MKVLVSESVVKKTTATNRKATALRTEDDLVKEIARLQAKLDKLRAAAKGKASTKSPAKAPSKSPLEADALVMSAVKPLLPEGVKLRRAQFTHMGMPQSGVFVSGKSDKVQSLQFKVSGTKLTVLQCPIGFKGNKYETWPVEGMQGIPLTAANIKKALKKFGYI